MFKAYESRPESWITEIHTDANGYVDYAVVCGQHYRRQVLRELLGHVWRQPRQLEL